MIRRHPPYASGRDRMDIWISYKISPVNIREETRQAGGVLQEHWVFGDNSSSSRMPSVSWGFPGDALTSLDYDFFICKLREGIELNSSNSKKTHFYV